MRLRTLILLLIVLIGASLAWDREWPMRLLFPLAHRDLIEEYAKENHVDPSLVAAVVFEESKFDPRARSNKGAMGLMQLMPSTAEWAAEKSGSDMGDLSSPETNIKLGTWYLHYLVKKYKDERLALAAYNGGEASVDKWLRQRPDHSIPEFIQEIPFKETREYVQRVTETQDRYQKYYDIR